MADWQAILRAPEEATILCTGDKDSTETSSSNGITDHYFYTDMTLPMSTFALAIGHWRARTVVGAHERTPSGEPPGGCKTPHDPYPCHVSRGDSGPLVPCRLFYATSDGCHSAATSDNTVSMGHESSNTSDSWLEPVTKYIRAALRAAYTLLGWHSFPKLDILVLPRCYSGLGLASPNLMFVSRSVFSGAAGTALTAMLVRISHEISHSWFGLVIGALDWTEEWLSEVRTKFARFSTPKLNHFLLRALPLFARTTFTLRLCRY